MGAEQGWLTIFRLALVQTAIGAVVVLTTSTLNRIIIVELALPAILPSMLIAVHYAVQLSRPRFGYGSDSGQRRTPWIIGGVAVLACGGVMAALATQLMNNGGWSGIALAFLAFLIIGAGVGAAGTSLLTLSAAVVSPARRGPAATIMFTMMIGGFVLTTALAAHFLEPFSFSRLVLISAVVGLIATITAYFATLGIEQNSQTTPSASKGKAGFNAAMRDAWREPATRRFAYFVFASMLAYSGQDVVLEPFGGLAFGLSPAQTTRLSAWQNGGIFIGMAAVAVAGGVFAPRWPNVLRSTALLGCGVSGICLTALALSPLYGPDFPLTGVTFALGLGLGGFTVSAIGAMMALAGAAGNGHEGLRMGIWGAAQALAFGSGGLLAGAIVDVVSWTHGTLVTGYMLVFLLEAGLFAVAAWLAVNAIQLAGTNAAAAFRSSPSHHKAA
ncbi:BCD family MFS transporter [Aureimonas fodinaquatilis]|uniref:BCD family MFS transporter n=1 Tax=Aureimonas fodinaquatilis TaxID=2565783 RepID=A0A5B0DTV7_9HYPH|nr:BCD family MFS transporter [Aureimonas fodinaquatilis]KAA0970194.1 BCD family MFS transporter [Aureimonas fodinaquatilis]